MNEEQKQIVEQFWDDYYIIDIPDKEIFLAFCENLVRMEANQIDIKDDQVEATDWGAELKRILIDIAGSNVIGMNSYTIDKLVRVTNYLIIQFKMASKEGYESEEVKSVMRASCEILRQDI